jgi:hypothetical protein
MALSFRSLQLAFALADLDYTERQEVIRLAEGFAAEQTDPDGQLAHPCANPSCTSTDAWAPLYRGGEHYLCHSCDDLFTYNRLPQEQTNALLDLMENQ